MTLGHNVPTYNLVIGVCIALMAGFAAFDNFAPKPSVRTAERKAAEDKVKVERELARLRDDFDLAQKDLTSRIWQGKEESASPLVLARLNDIAVNRGIKVNSFRPQKPGDNGGLTQLGFVMALEGSFPQVLNMVRDIEERLPRLAVHQINIATADQAAGTVNATLGLAAFVVPPKPESKTAPKTDTRRLARGSK